MFTNEYAQSKVRVKEMLESVLYTKQALVVKKQVLDDLFAMAVAARQYGGGADAKLQRRIEKLRREFLQDINALLVKKTKVKRGILALEDERVRTIFEAKYLKGLTWEGIADMMNYSVVHVKRLANENYYILERGL